MMNDLLLNYAQGLAEYQVLISACLIVFVFFAIGRDISQDERVKVVCVHSKPTTIGMSLK